MTNPPYHEPLTVIIPCRNAEDTIERAIQSACNAGADYVYVYDDASTDKSFEVLDSIWCKYPPLQIWSISECRSGVVFARNYLIEQADYGLIVPLDADDTLHDLEPFKLAFTPHTWLYGDWIERTPEAHPMKAPPPGVLARKNICHATMVFHKSDWQKAGGYDVDFGYAEDYGLQCALTHSGVKPVHVPAVLYDRYIQQNQRTAKAVEYWTFYRNMARGKYPAVFAGTG